MDKNLWATIAWTWEESFWYYFQRWNNYGFSPSEWIKTWNVKVKAEDFISTDVLKQNKAVLFDVEDGRAKVCFADTANKRTIETIRLLLLNRGLVMDRYVTFKSNIEYVLNGFGGEVTDKISVGTDITEMLDSIIKTAMNRRASDIHFEPMDDKVRIRYRIDGQLFDVADISKDKQSQMIGRLKAISNMHQEKQESQDRKNHNVSWL